MGMAESRVYWEVSFRMEQGIVNGSSSDAVINYVKKILKQKKMTQEEFAQLLYLDRTTVFRRLKSPAPMDADFKAALYSTLELNPTEIDEFESIIQQMEFGGEILSVYKAIDNVFFELAAPAFQPFDIRYHETMDRVQYRRAEVLFDQIFADAGELNFSCETTIINCIEPGIFPMLAMFLEKLTALGVKSRTSQYINMQNADMEKYFEMFSNIAFRFPLLHTENYSVYYNSGPKIQHSMLFDNSVLCSVSYGNGNRTYKHYWFVFPPEEDASCLYFTDEAGFTFIRHNMDIYIKQFKNLLYRKASDDTLLWESMDNIASATEVALIKPDPCYDMIPPGVYQSMRERCINTLDSKGIMFFANSIPDMGLQDAIDYFIQCENKRYEATYKQKRTDICTVNGLRAFALSGRLSENIEGIPPFTASETVQILQNIYNRTMDPNDSYSLYIIRKELLNNRFFLEVSTNGDLLIEPFFTRVNNSFNCIYIENQELSGLFLQYIKNRLCPRYAMTREERMNFLSRLIEEAGAVQR